MTHIQDLLNKVITVKLIGRINAIEGTLTGHAIIPFVIRVRLAWVKMYPGKEFDETNPVHLSQIKDIYLMNGQDWRTDPLFSG